MILRKILLVQTRKLSDFSTMFQLKNLETQKQVKNSIEGLKLQKKVIEEIDILLNKISKSKKTYSKKLAVLLYLLLLWKILSTEKYMFLHLMKNLICVSDIIKKFMMLVCDLPCCEIGHFCQTLYNYIHNSSRSQRLLRRNFYDFCKKYPDDFNDSFNVAKNKYIFYFSQFKKTTTVIIEKDIDNLSSLNKFD